MLSSGSHRRGGHHLRVLDIPPPEALRISPSYRRTTTGPAYRFLPNPSRLRGSIRGLSERSSSLVRELIEVRQYRPTLSCPRAQKSYAPRQSEIGGSDG